MATMIDDNGPAAVDVLIDAVIAPKLSFATHQNDVPVVHELKLVNLGHDPVMLKWWSHMADIMVVDDNGRPVSEPLALAFHLP